MHLWATLYTAFEICILPLPQVHIVPCASTVIMVFGLQYAARACKHEELERYFILLDLPAVIVIYNFIHSRRPVKCCG